MTSLQGIVHAAQVRNGIDGTVVANPNFDAENAGTTSFQDSESLTWTINGESKIVDGVPAGRRDTAESETLTAFTSGTDTGIEVATRIGPPWTTNPDHFPLLIKSVGTELRVTDIGPAVNDEFTRTESGGWGTSTSGHVWSIVFGNSTGFAVNGTQGTIQFTGTNSPIIEVEYDTDLIEVLCQFIHPALSGTLARMGVAIAIDSANNNWYELEYDTDGNTTIQRIDNAVPTTLITANNGPTFVANDTFNIRVRSKNGLHKFKVWNDSQMEPGIWNQVVFDDTYLSGNPGLRYDPDNSTDVIAFDNFQVIQPQLFTVDQAPANGISKIIPVGSSIGLAEPSTRALLGGPK